MNASLASELSHDLLPAFQLQDCPDYQISRPTSFVQIQLIAPLTRMRLRSQTKDANTNVFNYDKGACFNNVSWPASFDPPGGVSDQHDLGAPETSNSCIRRKRTNSRSGASNVPSSPDGRHLRMLRPRKVSQNLPRTPPCKPMDPSRVQFSALYPLFPPR